VTTDFRISFVCWLTTPRYEDYSLFVGGKPKKRKSATKDLRDMMKETTEEIKLNDITSRTVMAKDHVSVCSEISALSDTINS
jgi:hypothetical protein